MPPLPVAAVGLLEVVPSWALSQSTLENHAQSTYVRNGTYWNTNIPRDMRRHDKIREQEGASIPNSAILEPPSLAFQSTEPLMPFINV